MVLEALVLVGAPGIALVALVVVAIGVISLVAVGLEAVDLVDQVELEVGVGMIVAHVTDTSVLMDGIGMMSAGSLERGAETEVIVEVQREFGHGVMIGVIAGAEAGAGALVGAEVEAEAGVGQGAAGAGVGAMRGLRDRIMVTLLYLQQPKIPLNLRHQWWLNLKLLLWLGLKLLLYLSLNLLYLCQVICHQCHQARVMNPSLGLSSPVNFSGLMAGVLTSHSPEPLHRCVAIKQPICNADLRIHFSGVSD